MAAQQDFSEPGELSVFISPSQIDMLEAVMDRTGVLKSEQMGAAFAMLRSRDLLWTPAVNTYLRGKRESPNDLMAWNADGTRMPCRMHTEYLRGLYLNNALARGEFQADGRTVDLAAIKLPMFVIGTETDHVAPWKSVYKARGLTRSSDYTFLLTSGGHNAGIVSGPKHPRRRHRVRTWLNASETLTPEAWIESTAGASRFLVADVAALAGRAFNAIPGGPAVAGIGCCRLPADRRCARRVRAAKVVPARTTSMIPSLTHFINGERVPGSATPRKRKSLGYPRYRRDLSRRRGARGWRGGRCRAPRLPGMG